jgi:hypothetical protein
MDQLTAMRPVNHKDRLLVTLSRLGLFNTYEAIKMTVKALRSNRMRRQISKGLSDCDLAFFNDALAGGKRR